MQNWYSMANNGLYFVFKLIFKMSENWGHPFMSICTDLPYILKNIPIWRFHNMEMP